MDRINKKLLKDEKTGCLNWTGTKTWFGYGQIHLDKKNRYVHRVVYCHINKIPITTKLIIRHKCDNPSCCNIEHLIAGTQKENIQDIKDRNRHQNWNLKFCKRGHERIPENLYYLSSGSKACKICRKLRYKRVDI